MGRVGQPFSYLCILNFPIVAPGGTGLSNPITSLPKVCSQTVATCTPCSRSAPSSDRSSWRWGEHRAWGGVWQLLAQTGQSVRVSCRFTEMPTDNFIESSFWNFDALFQPQQHPARDQHDTFFLRGRWPGSLAKVWGKL